MKQELPEIYKNRSRLLRKSLDLGLSTATFLQLVTSMQDKTEEEKEAIAAQLLHRMDVVEFDTEEQSDYIPDRR